MKKWNILTNQKIKINDLVDLLLKNRGIATKTEKDKFLNPKLEDVTVENVKIDKKNLEKAIKRIDKAINKKEQIIVFGDYDVDGITGTAILWETLHALGANTMPYIPHRVHEGYGLSSKGIDNVLVQFPDTKLIITDDNGIVANDAVDYANSKGIDVIITDHHVASETLPKAHAIVHTTKLCGAGVAYLLSQELIAKSKKQTAIKDTHLELAALGTIADMVPLTHANRAIVKHGLSKICKSKRLGLQELFKQAGLQKETFTPYEVGYVIAPRLNAAGRIESAMESLRLLCTKDKNRALSLAAKLEQINSERQLVLKSATVHAIEEVKKLPGKTLGLIFVANASYQQGVIGLVAGKLVEEFYRPAIVISIGEKMSKASARSIKGFNLIEFLRLHPTEFINVGGHPMAAGFSIATSKIQKLKKLLDKSAHKILTDEIKKRSLKIDCELSLDDINQALYDEIQKLAPFGMGNSEPTFASTNVTVKDFKMLGKDKNHLKLSLSQRHSGDERSEDSRIPASPAGRSNVRDPGQARMTNYIDAIGFNMEEIGKKLSIGDKIDIAYAIDNNIWNGISKLQLKIRDIYQTS